MRIVWFSLIFVLFCKVGLAQNTAQSVVDSFFSIYEKQGYVQAIDYIFSTNKYLESQQPVVDQIKRKLDHATSIMGKYNGKEMIECKSLGNSFIMFQYLLKYDRQPILFSFILYKPAGKWQIHNFKLDDNVYEYLINLSND